jgi:hypothetical protein
MKMKYQYIYPLFAFLILLEGCKKDILDLSPQDKITDAEYWKTASDLQLYCNSFYNIQLPTITGFGTIGPYGFDADDGTDNMIVTAGYNAAMNGERVVPASASGTAWGTWNQLRNVNYFLANYSRVDAPAAAVNPFVGEAYFFRSWFYFGMLKTYGDLPWINKPLLPNDTAFIYGSRIKRNIIADSIIADLDKAISLLPTKSSAQAMRINKEIAMAFQSRVALYEGTWEKYHAGDVFGVSGSNGSSFLSKAATVAEQLIGSNVYQLDNVGQPNGYYKLFNQTDYSGSREVMFWRKYSISESPSFGHNWVITLARGGGRGLTKNLIDDYLCSDGKPVAGNPLYEGDDSLMHVVANRDPRLIQTICVPDGQHILTLGQPNVVFVKPGFLSSTAIADKNATGYQLYKGLSPDPQMQQNLANVGFTGQIYIRYAEVLLNFAEAKAELGTITQADLDKSINKLRQRVGMPNLNMGTIANDPNWLFPTLSPLINEIRRERRVELACEGFRKDDIFRWAAADQLIVGWKPKGAKRAQWTTQFTSSELNAYPIDASGYIELFKNVPAMAAGYKFNINRDYLSPIPNNELTLNPNLKQNPGW